MATVDDPVLVKFRAALNELYGDRIERVVLFGSQARGDARPDSDYDVAVFLKDLDDRWAELDRLANLRVSFLDETALSSMPNPIRPRLTVSVRRSCAKSDAKGSTCDAGSEPVLIVNYFLTWMTIIF
jgi:predicted nucleotidyltransferase